MIATYLLGFVALRAGAVEITVYNRNLALVQDRRAFDLRAGTNRVEIDGLPSQMDPSSVLLRCGGRPGEVSIVEQDFESALNPEALLPKYLGREIEIERPLPGGGGKPEVLKGVLLSQRDGQVAALRVGNKIHLNPPGSPILPDIQAGQRLNPVLIWSLKAQKSGSHDCAFSYLTEGFSWEADYSVVLGRDETSADFGVWAAVTNGSETAFKGVRLELLAGEPHRAAQVRPFMGMLAVRAAAMAPEAQGAGPFSEGALSEYHLYTLRDRAVDLPDHETKRIELARASGISVRKTYVYRGSQTAAGDFNDYTRVDPNYGVSNRRKVEAFVEFENAESNHLGIPLPAGRVRFYESDANGSLKFIGEDSLAHTPRGEKVKVALGNAFDFSGERRRTAFESDVHRRWARESFEISLKNHGSSRVSVEVVEPLYRWSGWKIEEASAAWRKKDAQTIVFDLPVPPDGQASLTYAVRYSW